MKTGHWAVWVVAGLVGVAGCTGQVKEGSGGGPATGGGSTSSSSGNPSSCPPREPKNHRPIEVLCPPSVTTMACTMDADCATNGNGPPGKCATTGTGNFCDFDECTVDADCSGPGNEVCSCQGQTFYGNESPGNMCIAANCRTDSDCGAGFYCSPTLNPSCGSFYGVQGYYCHTCQDTCVDDSDCAAMTNSPSGYCAFDPSVGHWACEYGVCAG